jgi:hypothetical protein
VDYPFLDKLEDLAVKSDRYRTIRSYTVILEPGGAFKHGFEIFKYGEAEVLARVKNSSLERLASQDVVRAQIGEARLWRLAEMPTKIKPGENNVWLLAHRLRAAMKKGG